MRPSLDYCIDALIDAIILSATGLPPKELPGAALGFASQPCDWFAFVEDRRRQASHVIRRRGGIDLNRLALPTARPA